MKRKSNFGSVAWQYAEMERICKKLKAGKKLDARDEAFIEVQAVHNARLRKMMR